MCKSQVWALLFLGYLAVVVAGVAVLTARRIHRPDPPPDPQGRHHKR